MSLERSEYLLSYESIFCICRTLCGGAGGAGGVSLPPDSRCPPPWANKSVNRSIDQCFLVVSTCTGRCQAIWSDSFQYYDYWRHCPCHDGYASHVALALSIPASHPRRTGVRRAGILVVRSLYGERVLFTLFFG